MKNRISLAAMTLLVAACATVCWACNVPVFRYALDHWRPDEYRAVVLHSGPLSEQSLATVKLLESEIDSQRLNLVIKQVDVLTQSQTALPDSLTQLNLQQAPALLVHYPADLEINEPIAAIPLDVDRLKQLVDSPLRQELRKRLADGQSAVFLFVASGIDQADMAVRRVLETELNLLQSTLELPKLTDDPDDKIQGGPALRIEFSVLELRHEDDAEWALRSMLLGSEPDLKDLKEPLVFPVFGRGRALWPLVGAGISAENLRESATFVSGACSCQVKEQNPGFDLLTNANWSELLPWTTGGADSHNLGESVEIAQTIPIPVGSNMTKELLAMGLGSATTGSADSQVPVEAASSGSTWIIVLAVVTVAISLTVAMVMRRRALA